MINLVSLVLALQLFDGLYLTQGTQVSAYVRSLEAAPGYVETAVRGGWQGRRLGVYGGVGITSESELTQTLWGVTGTAGRYKAGLELRTFRQSERVHRAALFKAAVQLFPQWSVNGTLGGGQFPKVQGGLVWSPEPWVLGVRWDEALAWVAGLQVAAPLWVGVGWEAGSTTFLHYRRGHVVMWARQRRHALLGSVQEVSLGWTWAVLPLG